MPRKHDLSDDDEGGPSGSSQASGSGSPPLSKRARTTGSPLPNSTPPRATQEGDEEEEEDEEMSDTEEQDQEALEQMRNTQQIKSSNLKIAEAGVITHVKLENFMCHYSTEVDFGPQVNFLVGVNGSGKSAVLTGITMALGGNAKATNRGTKGGDLIREGQTSARCAVTLANKGSDAFKPEIYGRELTIERTINKSGGGNYKIKNEDGKTIDTKKATLDAILDHFNLQVDNPMTVLTQDQSRQFLAKASARDKYNFFLRGTQLAQLTEEYEQIRANTETMEEALNRKKEVLPELKEAYKRAKDRAKEAQAAMEQQDKLKGLQDLRVWSYVEEMEEQIAFATREIQKEIDNGASFETQVNSLETELDEINGEINTAKEAEAESRASQAGQLPEIHELERKTTEKKARALKWKNEQRTINGQIGRQRAILEDLEKQIALEEAKLSRDIEAERAPIRAAIDKAENEITKIEIQVHEKEQLRNQVQIEYRRSADEYHDLKQQLSNASRQKDDLFGRRNGIQMAARNKLMKFGAAMPQLIQAIQNERGWRGRVVGPMGLHVKLNHPEYAKALDAFFNHYLNGFVCEDAGDADNLRRLIQRFPLSKDTMVLCVRHDDSFDSDLARGEPDPQILTVLRALAIDDQLVKQALINSNQIEKIALVPKRPDGDNLMRTDPRNVSRAFSADMYQLRHSGGRSSSTSMRDWTGSPRLEADVSQSIAAIDQEIQRIENDMRGIEQRRVEAGQRAKAEEQRMKALENEIKDHQRRKRRLEQEIGSNTEKLTEEQPSNISALLASKTEVETEIANMTAQYQAGLEQYESESEDMRPAVERLNFLRHEVAKADKLTARITDILADLYGKVNTIEGKLKRARRDMEDNAAKIKAHQAEAKGLQEQLETRTEQAASICERPPPERVAGGKRRTPERLAREIEAIERVLREREKRQGATTEQIVEEMHVRKKVAQDAIRQTNELGTLISQLAEAYESRTTKWTDFRAHICHRAKMQFGFYLSNRGFHGKLKFDHDRTQLHLAVQTDADKGKEKSKRKDAAALSGGEKSFSTICLLLTMWEAVGCPLRCLDEFDVFMDAVNRRIAMTMMIDTAKSADQTQFILITPQEMGSIAWGKEVKVVKMGDPKRNKGALAAGR